MRFMERIQRLSFFIMLSALVFTFTGALGETTVIKLTCAGDAMLGCNEKVRQQDYSFDRYIDAYGYAYPFEKLQELFASDDITLVNLEVVLANAPSDKAMKSRYIFRGTTDYAKILTAGSVEAVNLANNHTMDYGAEGLASTVAALESEGVGYCGSLEGGSYTYVFEKDGIRVGFAGVVPAYWAASEQNKDDLRAQFESLRQQGCQVIVASLHCGREYYKEHDSIHEKYERICLSLGANLIIGTHPHVPQGVQVTGGVTHLYSLGNSAFGGNTGVDETLSVIQSFVAQFDLVFEDGVYTGHQMTLWPIHISGTSPENNYQPVLVTGDEAQKVMRMIQKDTDFKLAPYVDGEGAVQPFVAWPQ